MTARLRVWQAPLRARTGARIPVAVALIAATVSAAAAQVSSAQSSSAQASAATDRVRGVVVSALDGRPIVAAEFVVGPDRVVARSDPDGRFDWSVASARAADVGPPSRRDPILVRLRALGHRDTMLALAAGTEHRIALRAAPTALAAVTTTAGNREFRVSESPASLLVVDSAAIAASAAASANQVLRNVPGLQELPSPPTRSTIAIRGLDGARVLVLMDGEPVAGGLLDVRDIGRASTFALDRIEVAKGPSSAEFGSDALGGVINLVSAAPAQRFDARLSARAGELGRREGAVDVSDTRGAFGYRLGGGWRQADRVTAVTLTGSSLDRVYDGRAQLRYRASARVRLRADAHIGRERQRWPVGGGNNGFLDNRTVHATTELHARLGPGSFRVRAAAQWFDYEYRQATAPVPVAGTGDSLAQHERTVRALAAYTGVVGAHVVDAGVQWSARAIAAPSKVAGDRASERVAEIFLRDAWTRGRVVVTGGLRGTTSSSWGGAVAPSFGVAWQVSERLRARASAATGYRAPSFKERRYTFANAAAGYEIIGNGDLRPERSLSTDAGLVWAVPGRGIVELSAYRTAVSNLIDTRFTGYNTVGLQVYRNLNVARARIEGFEFSGTVVLPGELSRIFAGYNVMRTRDVETGRPLDRRAGHTAQLRFSHDWATLAPIRTDISLNAISSASVGELEQGARASVDVLVRATVVPRAELSAGVNNAFDANPAMWTPAFRRQAFVGVTLGMGSR